MRFFSPLLGRSKTITQQVYDCTINGVNATINGVQATVTGAFNEMSDDIYVDQYGEISEYALTDENLNVLTDENGEPLEE